MAKQAIIDATTGKTTYVDAPEIVTEDEVPATISNWKGHALLIDLGIDADQVRTAIMKLVSDPKEQGKALIAFDRADFDRASPLLNAVLKDVFGKTDADIDTGFRKTRSYVI